MNVKKTATLALSISLAMVFSFLESQIPAFVSVPGVKMGLPNIVIVFLLYRFGWKEAALVSTIRVFLTSVLFGSGMSYLYAISGAVLSLSGMILLKKIGRFSQVTVSIAGGVLHNAGQIAMACYILGTSAIAYYLPFLIISGILAGIVVGIAAGILVKRIPPI